MSSTVLQGKTIGEFSKDKFPGDFMEAWQAKLNTGGFDKVRFQGHVFSLNSVLFVNCVRQVEK